MLAARIDMPQEGSTISGRTQVLGSAQGEAFDGWRIDFRPQPEDSAWKPVAEGAQPAPFGPLAQWQTANLLDGYYVLRLTVFDSTGREEISMVRVIVDNTPPVVRWVYPQEGATLQPGPIVLLADASDNLGLAQVDFFVDSELVGSFAAPPFSLDWQAAPGRYDLRVEAVDRAGSSAIHVIGGVEVK